MKRLSILLALIWGVVLGLSTGVIAQTVSQGYGTDGGIQKGMIVMVNPKDSKKVSPLSNKKDAAMHGVVVAANDTVVSLGGDGTDAEVFVATNGKYDVLVSTQNGPINIGDLISISAIDGIGMKANAEQTVILGRSLSPFNGKGALSATDLSTSQGKQGIQIGLISVDIGISHNPLAIDASGPPVPDFIKRVGHNLAGKPVSSVRLYTALGILFVTGFMTGSLLYGGVRSSLVAIGRNPLAKKAILKGLIQVIVLGMIVFVIGLFAIYLLLKL